MLNIRPIASPIDNNIETVKPKNKKDRDFLLMKLNKHNKNKKKLVNEIHNKMQKRKVSDSLPEIKQKYNNLDNIGETDNIIINARYIYKNYLIDSKNNDLHYMINRMLNFDKVDYTKGDMIGANKNYIEIEFPEKIVKLRRGDDNKINNKFLPKKVTIKYIIKENNTDFKIIYPRKPIRSVRTKINKPSTDSIIKIVNEIKNTEGNHIIDIISPYYNRIKLVEITKIIENMKDSILIKYNLNTPSLIDTIIKKYNLNYLHIPQKKRLIISKNPISFEQDYFTRVFPEKQELTQGEWSKILLESEIPRERVEVYKMRPPSLHKTIEYEKLCNMKKENIINTKEIKYYKYIPHYSKGTKKDIIRLIKEGKRTRKNLLDNGYEKLVDSMDSSKTLGKTISPIKN